MSLVTRTFTFTDGTTAYGSQVESEIANLANIINGLDAGTTTWDIVKAVNASSTPLIADNSTGSNAVADFRVNGVSKVNVGATGVLTCANTIAMSTTKITGLAAGTTTGDAIRFEQLTGPNIVGSATNDSATAGNIGEVIESKITTQANFPSNGTYGDLTSITLTAGTWLIAGWYRLNTGTSTGTTEFTCGISTTTGNSSTGLVEGDTSISWAIPSGTLGVINERWQASIPAVWVKLAGSTIYYLKYEATYANGQPLAVGRITAVRIR